MTIWILGFVVYLLARKQWPKEVTRIEKLCLWLCVAVAVVFGAIFLYSYMSNGGPG